MWASKAPHWFSRDVVCGGSSLLGSPHTTNFAMPTLVTGGAGFIGSHLVKKLLESGEEVICLDSCFSGSKSNLKAVWNHPNFEFMRHDITHPFLVEVDKIYHLACPASPVHYQHNAIKTLKTNVLGTLNVLGLAKRTGARVLLASTSEIYGDAMVHPQPETYHGNVNCIGLRSCYDEGKRAAEALCMDYHRQHQADVRIARIFNTYGPGMFFHDGRVVSNFIVEALRREPLSVYGTGSQTRSFCYVDDLVDGLVKLMEGPHIGPINLGNPTEFTILELATMIKEVSASDVAIEFLPLPKDDPARRKPDITLAKSLLNWEPTTPLRKGLEATFADFLARARENPSSLTPRHQNEVATSVRSSASVPLPILPFDLPQGETPLP